VPGSTVLWGGAILGLALLVRVVRIHAGPDVLSDELQYTAVAAHLGRTGTLKDYFGYHQIGDFFTHPPLFYVLAAVFQKVTGGASLRYFSAIVGAVTAAEIFWLARSLGNQRTGVVAGLLFALSPLAVRIDRMAMIESLAVLVMVVFVHLFWRGMNGRPWVVPCGACLGVGFLTKELVVFVLLVPLVFTLVYRDHRSISLPKVLAVVAIGMSCYLPYVAWGLATNYHRFWLVKTESVRRVLGLKVTTGYSLPRYPSPVKDIVDRIGEIGPDILTGVVAVLASVRAVLRRRLSATLAMTWLLSVAVFLVAAHIYNFQFVVYLVPAAAIGLALAATGTDPADGDDPADGTGRADGAEPADGTGRANGAVARRVAAVAVVVILAWSSVAVAYRYVFTTDMATTQAGTWVEDNVPNGALVYGPQELSWLAPDHGIVNPYYFPKLGDVRRLYIHWVVISPRTSYMLDPATLHVVETRGRVVAHFRGVTSRGVDVVYLQDPLGG
jgi:4-amino-4-deoxy-L-arabinose transferase-like glycosyltransferase